MSKTLRGGRLASKRHDVAEFTSSIKDDARLASAVIDINRAHVVMLAEQKIISPEDAAKLLAALRSKLDLNMDISNEDVHMAVEEAVLQQIGPDAGGNMHIAKSRNDQVATAIRMELRKKLVSLMLSVVRLQDSLLASAEKHLQTIILEFTHVQPAQPVTFGHYLIARFDALDRDLQRLREAYVRVNLCPLGSGALATTSFPINRERVAELLGCDGLVENSIDAVGSRDFVLESIASLTILAVDLSQVAEDLVLWSSPDIGVLELPDDFYSTSSMMPQKKNPEVPEIIRARASHVIGDFVSAAVTMKGMPSTYNLDFQEVTPKLWAALENVDQSLKMLSVLVPNLKVQSDVSEKALKNFVAATELANMLVRKYNVPFRSAHKIVGALVKNLVISKQTFKDATVEMIQNIAKNTVGITLTVQESDISQSVDLPSIVASHNVTGGPAPSTVKKALAARKKHIAQEEIKVSKFKQNLENAEIKLNKIVISMTILDSVENGRFKTSKRSVK